MTPIELTSTRANPMIDPMMHVWGWEIPVYLFLGGMVAGMMVISGYLLFSGRARDFRCACFVLPTVGLGLLGVGMGSLFLDLEHKLYFWRLYTTFELRSPMSWGSWILLLVVPALLGNLLLRLPEPIRTLWPALAARSERWFTSESIVRALGLANIGLGIALGIYTGILLSTLGARPFWSSAVLGPLFLFSGLSAAAAFVHLVARHPEERVLMARADNIFLGSELLLLVLFLIGLLTGSRAQAQAVEIILGGSWTAFFWVAVVGLGLVAPLFLQILAVSHRIQHTPVAPILVMAGSLALRWVVVAAGQASHWPLV